MIINHNIGAMDAHRNLFVNTVNGDKDLEKLSSGLRINRGADDAAGLAVSEKMRAQVRGLAMARRNAQDGVSLIQTAEGYLQETSAALLRIRELSVQAANGVYEPEDRQQIQTEVSQLLSEVERIAKQAQFNKKTLFTGDYQSAASNLDATRQPIEARPEGPQPTSGDKGPGIRIHLGPNMDQYEMVTIDRMTLDGLGISPAKDSKDTGTETVRSVSVLTEDQANKSLAVVDEAIRRVNKQRTDLGAFQNRLETAMRGIEIAHENLQAAESRIRDTDMGQQMIDFVKNSILSQASVSMLAQANLRPQMVLRVLG